MGARRSPRHNVLVVQHPQRLGEALRDARLGRVDAVEQMRELHRLSEQLTRRRRPALLELDVTQSRPQAAQTDRVEAAARRAAGRTTPSGAAPGNG